ncbi:hypothetical protein [Lysobacter sp. A421]
MKPGYVVIVMASLAFAGCTDSFETGSPVDTAAAQAEAEASAQTEQDGSDANAEATDTTAGEAAVEQAIETNLGDAAAYRATFDRLQRGVGSADKQAVAALVSYPINVEIDGKPRVIRDAQAFIELWDQVITPGIASVITSQQFADLRVNYQGVMFGDGQVWLTGICRDDACAASDIRVVTIQSGPASPDPLAFTVDVTLSDSAKEQFSSSGETVIVGATYFADPAADAGEDVINDVGQVDLGSALVTLPGEGQAAFGSGGLQRDRLDLIEGEPQVNINVWSGRKSSPDNLLDCDMFQDAIAVAASQPVAIDCRLLDEGNQGA